MRFGLLIVVVLAALAGCASTYEARVERSLVDAGLPRPLAGCMAPRLADRLSGEQLRSLGRLAGLKNRDIGAMRVEELIERSRALLDPEVYAVLARSGVGCAIAG